MEDPSASSNTICNVPLNLLFILKVKCLYALGTAVALLRYHDDDDLNCEMVGKLLPEVEVVHLPKDPTRYLNTLINRNLFDTFTITKEDLNKGEMYEAENQRKKLRKFIFILFAYQII